MKTNPAARRRQISAALSVLVMLALSACASAPSSASATADPVRAGHSQTVKASPLSQPSPASSAARANRRMFAVAYSPSGSVVVTSSGAPTVEQLPSGLFRVTFPLVTAQQAQAPEVAQASR